MGNCLKSAEPDDVSLLRHSDATATGGSVEAHGAVSPSTSDEEGVVSHIGKFFVFCFCNVFLCSRSIQLIDRIAIRAKARQDLSIVLSRRFPKRSK